MVDEKIKLEDVVSVYSGIDGNCCCGCSGKHTYAAKHRDIASKSRGYTVKDEEINDRSVKRIVNILNKAVTTEHNRTYASVTINKRLYIAYFKEEENV